MRNRFRHLRRDERGMSLIFVGGSLMALLTATTLAIDVGMFMTARSQAQNSADAGALSGATSLAFDSYTDRSATGPAKSSSVSTALANSVMRANVSVTPSDVSFPLGPTGLDNRVQVNVYRDAAHSNPLPTLMGAFFGVNQVDVRATATAEASPASAARCVKPFMIPDKWQERRPVTAPWDPNTSEFDMYDNHGNLLDPADYYSGLGNADYTGYNSTTDKGTLLIIRAGNGNNIEPTMYYSWNMPGNTTGITGGDWYRENIAACNPYKLRLPGSGQPPLLMEQEPGDMTGPTIQGTQDLYDLDPRAYWEDPPGCNCIRNSAFGGHTSPRIFPIPVYDPVYYAEGKKNGRNADFKLANIIGIFLDRRPNGNQIYGRITPIIGDADDTAGPAPAGAFATAIRLVQ